MKDFVDYQDLCYGLKKVFAEDFNKNLLPQVTSDPNLKLEPENVRFAVGPFLDKFFGPNTKVSLLTKLYPIYEPEKLIDSVVNGISLEEAASLDKDITLNKFMGEYSVTSVPFYARTNKEIADKIKDNLEKLSSGNFTKEDIETFTVVNHLCDVMRADLTSMINGTDKAIDLSVNFNLGSYKAIMPFMSVDDPQIVKLFQDHELTPKEQEKLQLLKEQIDRYNNWETIEYSATIGEQSKNGHFELSIHLPKSNEKIKACFDFTNVNELATKLCAFIPTDSIRYYLSEDLDKIKNYYANKPQDYYPSLKQSHLTHKDFDKIENNLFFLNNCVETALSNSVKLDKNQVKVKCR